MFCSRLGAQLLYIFTVWFLPGLPPTTSIPNAGQLWNLIPGPLCGAVDVIQAAIIYALRPIFLDKRKRAWRKLSAAIKYPGIHLLVFRSLSKCDVMWQTFITFNLSTSATWHTNECFGKSKMYKCYYQTSDNLLCPLFPHGALLFLPFLNPCSLAKMCVNNFC